MPVEKIEPNILDGITSHVTKIIRQNVILFIGSLIVRLRKSKEIYRIVILKPMVNIKDAGYQVFNCVRNPAPKFKFPVIS